MTDDDAGAASFFSFSLGGQLVTLLQQKGLITRDEAKVLYDQVLLNLEANQTNFPDHQKAFEKAREIAKLALDSMQD